jgi:hypothetical protein
MLMGRTVWWGEREERRDGRRGERERGVYE